MDHVYVFIAMDENETQHTIHVYRIHGGKKTIDLPEETRLLTDKGEIVKALGQGFYEIQRGSRKLWVQTDDKNAEKFST